jgi:hypothetical protein
MLDFDIHYLLTTETRRAQRELFFLPDRETAIGQEIAALRARSNNWVSACQWLDLGSRAFAAGEGSFPWPSSPGQGKTTSSVYSVPLW